MNKNWGTLLPEKFINTLSYFNSSRRMEANDVRNLMEAYGSIYESDDNLKFEAWVNQLIEEGYDLSEYTWDEMTEIYMSETASSMPSSVSSYAKSTPGRVKKPTSSSPTPGGVNRLPSTNSGTHNPKNVNEASYEDAYDYVLNYLISEGYADNEESATVIMANMSEEWVKGILSEASNSDAKIATDSRTVPYLKGTTTKPLNIPFQNRVAATLKRVLNLPVER